MTTRELALAKGVHPRTIKRRIEKMNGSLVALNGGTPFAYGFGDHLPDPVVEFLQSSAEETTATPSTPASKEKEVKQVQVTPSPKAPLQVKTKKALDVNQAVFQNRVLIVLFAAVLISVDSLSFGWIAWNTYPTFRETAAVIFAVAGMAVGYSAVKNIISYKGWNGDAWAWGFGLFQLALHLCAMEVLGDLSFFIGKIVISSGLPLATAGLATALKMDTQ